MLKKSCEAKKVTFKINAPTAKDVRLAGDFNSWNTTSILLKKTRDGVWKRDLDLKPGRYEYKYIVDGKWQRDSFNKFFVMNSYGSENSVIEL